MTKLHLVAAMLALPLLASPSRADPYRIAAESLTIDALKSAYLACDRETSRNRMEPATASRCIAISSALMERAFDGDFDRLIAWWREEKVRAMHAVTD